MTEEQKAAYVIAQAALLSARVAMMQAANQYRVSLGAQIAYGEGEMYAVIEEFEATIGIRACSLLFQQQTAGVRVKASDKLGNVAYIYRLNGRWTCTLADGTPASFTYAGMAPKDTEIRFALEDCHTADEVLDVCRKYGKSTYGLV